MSEKQSFNRRAVLAGPAGFRKALVEGTNHYIAQAMEIINAAPHEDLPLVIAAMGLLAEDLKQGFDGKDWKPGYVDFLTRIVKDSCETTLISVLVPAEEDDGD